MKRQKITWAEPELAQTTGVNSRYPCHTDCGDIMFVNQGTTTALVNNMPLPPGASVTFGANSGEETVGVIYIQAQPAVGALGVYIFRKLFVDN